MKKAIFLLILLTFSWSVYPFWVWSPKTQKWKNPKYSALSTPYLQYKAALKIFEEGRYKEAHKEFKKFLAHYPDAKEAAESQYYLGRCLEKFDKSYEAFLVYQKLIDSYPNSQRINEVIEREYNIGESFLNREHKKWLGLSLYDFVEHPSILIFNSLVNKAPYSEYAPRAQYKLGIILFELGRFDEARDAFQKVVDNYSDTEWAPPAKYQLAIATSKAFPGADYDSSYLQEATARLDEFIKEHPEAKISDQAEDQLKILRNREAKKNFEIAQFYENQDQYESAVIYYRKVLDEYIDSDYYDSSLEKVQELNQLIEGNLTKKDLILSHKKEAAQTKKAEKIRAKDRKKDNKQELRQNKIDTKKRIRQEAKISKELRRKEKLALKSEARAKKEIARAKKLREKQDRAQEKKNRAKERREEKLARKNEAKAKKQALRAKELKKREAPTQGKKELVEEKSKEKFVELESAKAKKVPLKSPKLKKKQDQRERKQALLAEKRQRKIERKAQKRAKKEFTRIKKLKKKEELIQKKKDSIAAKQKAKLDRSNEAKARKEAAREEKLRQKAERLKDKQALIEKKRAEKLARRIEAKVRKEAIREKKLKAKQECIQKAKQIKAQKRQEKLIKKQKAKAKKMALKEKKRKEKLAKESRTEPKVEAQDKETEND
ncbi:MAG: outer membrane protein assembly factor BamD [Candidatus Omnitrophica bacterium]|nr:outer membrane protein assembly factor BamD [Candidatus Omnitrophota bacterium]